MNDIKCIRTVRRHFKVRNMANKVLETFLNENSQDGWQLHSIHRPEAQGFGFTVVWYKDIEE